MSETFDRRLAQARIFPRNLTARAATMVRGNPANARPESGVDNTHPGLEFDQRNLDQRFFPGLTFEFQFLTGARVAGVDPALLPLQATGDAAAPMGPALTAADLSEPRSSADDLHLLYLCAAFGANPGQFRMCQLYGLDGYEVLRTIRDLEPGPLLLIIGRKLPTSDPAKLPGAGMGLMQYGQVINDAIENGAIPAIALPPVRDADGRLLAAMLIGNRSAFLDANGVITGDAAPPGLLTQSLCAPWQWDFADCGCHYWAANKPDIVFGEDGEVQSLNFQRDRSQPAPVQPAAGYAAWTAGIMSQPAMIRDWESLPFVIAERETDRAPRPADTNEQQPWTRARVIAELTYLAGIEHALAIEYLYAYYSLDAPRQPPADDAPAQVVDVFTAAQVIRGIAVDEMRHFRWVNEALQLLGADICLDRALEFRQGPNSIQGRFELLPLTPERLDYFISVEAPSRYADESDKLDGLYTHLLKTLGSEVSEIEPAIRGELAEIIKLIIDEGHQHWLRFKGVRELLSKYDPRDYLRIKAAPGSEEGFDHDGAALDLADSNYHDLLASLAIAFASPPINRAARIADARLLMYNLDDAGVELAIRGVGMRFTLPPVPGAGRVPQDRRADLLAQLFGTRNLLQLLANSADEATAAMIGRQRGRITDVIKRLRVE